MYKKTTPNQHKRMVLKKDKLNYKIFILRI